MKVFLFFGTFTLIKWLAYEGDHFLQLHLIADGIVYLFVKGFEKDVLFFITSNYYGGVS